MQTLRVISALMHYPEAEVLAAADELVRALREENLVSLERQEELAGFVYQLAERELMEAQADYVALFDRGRALALHLFEHVHGESRDRGQAMVDLLEMYKAGGFEVAFSELPDYLPLFLEYLSTRPEAEAKEWLEEVAHILQLLHARLRERGSEYALLFAPLLELAGEELEPEQVRRQVVEEPRDDTPEAMDQAWAEEPITFGPDAAPCPSARPGGRQPEVFPVQTTADGRIPVRGR